MSENHIDLILTLLNNEGVTINNMSEITFDLQKKYIPNLSYTDCENAILVILAKREVQFAALTGIELDRLAQENKLTSPLQEVIEKDYSLFGIDEILALSITNIYGSIASTTFGYLDNVKPGIIGELDKKANGKVHTFLDDIVCAIIGAACSRLAHSLTK